MDTQKIRLNETFFLSTQNICLNWWVRKYSQFYAKLICSSKPMTIVMKIQAINLTISELVSSIRYWLACAYSEDSNQSAHLHSLIRILVFCLRNVCPWLSIEHSSKTLIRLCGCAGWSVIDLLTCQLQATSMVQHKTTRALDKSA